mmetsp:Transcript_82064/g.206470  ORF Transcript_82064/g.206470 Transcript_82064/m.206470 type:complete len:233 (+) Transcript_82064:944-1642(+)
MTFGGAPAKLTVLSRPCLKSSAPVSSCSSRSCSCLALHSRWSQKPPRTSSQRTSSSARAWPSSPPGRPRCPGTAASSSRGSCARTARSCCRPAACRPGSSPRAAQPRAAPPRRRPGSRRRRPRRRTASSAALPGLHTRRPRRRPRLCAGRTPRDTATPCASWRSPTPKTAAVEPRPARLLARPTPTPSRRQRPLDNRLSARFSLGGSEAKGADRASEPALLCMPSLRLLGRP